MHPQSTPEPGSDPLGTFVSEVELALTCMEGEPALLSRASDAMRRLVATDEWLPARFARPDAARYQQFLLHRNSSFSVVSFVWGPGQSTPVHDHTVWGVVGMLRGSEYSQSYTRNRHEITAEGEPMRMEPGDVLSFSPLTGDIHRVWNSFDDRVSISIHVYGADIGCIERHVFDLHANTAKAFVSGYANSGETS